MEHWPAVSRWQRPQYFLDVAGLRTVPVELGQHYLDADWGQALMPLADFITQHMLRDCTDPQTGASASNPQPHGQSNYAMM